MIDHLIYGAIGFVLGGVIGGAIVGRIVTKDMKNRLDDLEECNKLLVNKVAAMRDEKLAEKEKNIEKLEKETKLDNYNSLRKRYVSSAHDDDEEDESEEEDDDLADEDEDEASKIKMISEQQFNEEINYRDHEELTYYQGDGTLVDAANEIITKEETVVGSEIMDIIDETRNDNLYALDDNLNKVYDITIEHDASYIRDMYGIM